MRRYLFTDNGNKAVVEARSYTEALSQVSGTASFQEAAEQETYYTLLEGMPISPAAYFFKNEREILYEYFNQIECWLQTGSCDFSAVPDSIEDSDGSVILLLKDASKLKGFVL